MPGAANMDSWNVVSGSRGSRRRQGAAEQHEPADRHPASGRGDKGKQESHRRGGRRGGRASDDGPEAQRRQEAKPRQNATPTRKETDSAPAFVLRGWLFPQGVNRKQRRAAAFAEEGAAAEARALGARYVGTQVPDGPADDPHVRAALQRAEADLQRSFGDDAGAAAGFDSPQGSPAAPVGSCNSSTPGMTTSGDCDVTDRSPPTDPSPERGPGCSDGGDVDQDCSDSEDGPQPNFEPIAIGDRVIVSRRQGQQQVGTVQYVGYPDFTSRGPGFEGEWYGVALDAPEGNHDGEIDGVRYFTALPMHGVFVRRDKMVCFGPSLVDVPPPPPCAPAAELQQHSIPGPCPPPAQLVPGAWPQCTQIHLVPQPMLPPAPSHTVTTVIKVIRCGPPASAVPAPGLQGPALLNGVPLASCPPSPPSHPPPPLPPQPPQQLQQQQRGPPVMDNAERS